MSKARWLPCTLLLSLLVLLSLAKVPLSRQVQAAPVPGKKRKLTPQVVNGLRWLALHQATDGHWSLHEFNRYARTAPFPGGRVLRCTCSGTSRRKNDIAATAFGVLPFLAAGYTHKAKHVEGPDYTRTVQAGLRYLVSKQGRDGSFSSEMYSNALATITVCEAYGLSKDPALKARAQVAINFIAAAQHNGGGWRYRPRQAGDTSMTGWQVKALHIAHQARLNVPRTTRERIGKYLDSAESKTRPGQYSYLPGRGGPTPSMTAVGLLCRQYLGADPKSPAQIAGMQYLLKYPLQRSPNMYHFVHVTPVMHNAGGVNWKTWVEGKGGKGGLYDFLNAKQDRGATTGQTHQQGSWPATKGDEGRIMSTSLSLLCLLVEEEGLLMFRRVKERE